MVKLNPNSPRLQNFDAARQLFEKALAAIGLPLAFFQPFAFHLNT
jgi:hypothetical protein